MVANYNWRELEDIITDPELVYGSFETALEAEQFMELQNRVDSLASKYSDMFKDTYGIRPRGHTEVHDLPLEEQVTAYEMLIEGLMPQLEETIREEKEMVEKAESDLESRLKKTMILCNCSREDAFKFILQAEDLENEKDPHYIAFVLGVQSNVVLKLMGKEVA